jgi:hypothetical protein
MPVRAGGWEQRILTHLALPSSPPTSAASADGRSPRRGTPEPFELLGVSPERGCSPAGSCRSPPPSDGELQPAVEPLDASEDAHRVALGEAAVEELDVVPHPPLDASARIDELERQIGLPAAGRQPALAGDGVTPSTVRSSTSSAIVATA